jgi:uncharacterized membrane protein YeaQ/YmgE (transglycosylase-associated protein family)
VGLSPAPGQDRPVDPRPDEDPKDPFRLGDDPGWNPSGRAGVPDGLVGLRMTFSALCAGLLVVGVVVGLLADSVADRDGGVPGVVGALAVVVVGVIGLAIVRFVPVRLDCADELALARSWRSRFFARCTASTLPALAGFAAFALSGVPALYPLGLAFAAAGLAVSGPFHATLVRDQERLALDGCAISLVPALRRPVDDLTR